MIFQELQNVVKLMIILAKLYLKLPGLVRNDAT